MIVMTVCSLMLNEPGDKLNVKCSILKFLSGKTLVHAFPTQKEISCVMMAVIAMDGFLKLNKEFKPEPSVTNKSPMTQTRMVFVGISESSVGGTDARTSSYIES